MLKHSVYSTPHIAPVILVYNDCQRDGPSAGGRSALVSICSWFRKKPEQVTLYIPVSDETSYITAAQQLKKLIMLRFWDRANAITLGSLVLSCFVAFFVMRQHYVLAVIALIGAGVCDLVDGLVARRLKRTEEQQVFGKRLDSLVDACAFGMAPAILCCGLGLSTLPDIFLLGAFVCCIVWRLAFFDTVGMEDVGGKRFYVGLPTTYVALVFPLVFLTALIDVTLMRMLLRVAVLGLASAMVSSVRFPKPGAKGYAFLLTLAIVVVSLLGLQMSRFQSAMQP